MAIKYMFLPLSWFHFSVHLLIFNAPPPPSSPPLSRTFPKRVLKPAIWLPVLRYPHNWWETWTVETAEPEECVLDMGRAIEKVAASASAPEGVGGGNMLFHLDSLRYSAEDRTGYATMLCVTKARWMDIVELKIRKPQDGSPGSEIEAHG